MYEVKGERARRTHCFEKDLVCAGAVLDDAVLDHGDCDLGGLEGAWGVEGGHDVRGGRRGTGRAGRGSICTLAQALGFTMPEGTAQ